MSVGTEVEVNGLANVSNDAKRTIGHTEPYTAEVTIRGTAPILFHRWSIESIEKKANAKKGSKDKKTDDVESYVYRCDDGTIGIPGRYLVGSIINPKNGAAKYHQDPRSPRKSALDLFKAGVVPLTLLASTGKATWDYIDQQRVTIQGAGITRSRPALNVGWEATFQLGVLLPEYIDRELLLEVLVQAGRLVGVGDYRPTYGRFQITSFKIVEAE